MGKLTDQVYADRAARNALRDRFDNRLAGLRQDLDEQGIGSRIADKLGEQAHAAYDEAMAVAGENKGVIAGTIGALVVWIFRNPIIASIDRLLGHDGAEEEVENDD